MKKIITLLCLLALMQNGFAGDHPGASYVNHTLNISGCCNSPINVYANIGDSVSLSTLVNGILWAPSEWWFSLCGLCSWDSVTNGSLANPLNIVITQYGIYHTLTLTGLEFTIIPPIPLEIQSFHNINSLNVFPTTVTSSITIQLNSIKPNDIEIAFYDMNGRQLINHFYKSVSGEFIKNENTEALANGMYFLRIKTGDEMVERKFVKM